MEGLASNGLDQGRHHENGDIKKLELGAWPGGGGGEGEGAEHKRKTVRGQRHIRVHLSKC